MKPKIFISYAHNDLQWLDALRPGLMSLELGGLAELYFDGLLLGGDEWDKKIKAELETTDVFLAIVARNFVGSRYVHQTELPIAKQRQSEGKCIIVPVLCEDVYWNLLGLNELNFLPKDDAQNLKAVELWPVNAQNTALGQVVRHLHKQIESITTARNAGTATAARTGIDLALYRQRAQAKWSAIDLAALARPGAADPDIIIRLGDVFIPQHARRSRPPVTLPRDWLRGQGIDADKEEARAEQIARTWEQLSPEPALDLIADPAQRRLVLLGDPGAGKSALTRYVLLQLLAETPPADSPLAALHGHLPLLIELRDFVLREAEGRCTDLLSYLGFIGSSLGFGFNADAVADHLARDPALLIIDGLDEIFDPQRRRLMVDQIVGLATRFPQLRLLITARIAGFDDQSFRSADFVVATLVDLSQEQVAAFAQHWFTLVFPGDPVAAERAREDLFQTVQRRPQLRALAGNPMLLTIMATIARHKPLARSRAAVYAQALELLCYNWDYRRGLNLPTDSPLRDLTPDDTPLILRRIAWRMQAAEGGLRANAIAQADLLTVLEEFFRNDWHLDAPKARRAAQEMEHRLQERNWVVTLRGPALYGFVHRTFLEYLCATEIAEQFKTQSIDADGLIGQNVAGRQDDDSWREVLRLLVGLLPLPAAERVIAAIVPSVEELARAAPRLGLAWQALAEIDLRYVPTLQLICADLTARLYRWLRAPGTGASFSQYSDNLSACHDVSAMVCEAVENLRGVEWPVRHPPEEEWPALASREFGDAWFVFLQPTMDIVVALGKTAWNCATATMEMLRARAVNDPDAYARGAALSALARHFRDDARTADLLRARAIDDPDASARGAALSALARHFRDDARTADLLRARAIDDPDASARGAALSALARHFRDDARTADLLRARAIDDPDASARGAALGALAQHFRDDARTADMLRARAIDDPGAYARGAALSALAQHFRDDARTADLLRARAIDDPDAYARGAALSALAQHFRDDARTADLLRARAIDDPDAYARREALSALAEHFRDDARTADLLRARAIDDPGASARGAALSALARHFRDDARTADLLRARAIDDPDADARRAALLGLSQSLSVEHASVLCSRDLDGFTPGIDARNPVTQAMVSKAASRLGRQDSEIRDLYEQIARIAPLTLAWQASKRKRRH